MRRFISIIFAIYFAFLGVGCSTQNNPSVLNANTYIDTILNDYEITIPVNPPKVILDCDMTYMGDDMMCLCILAQADSMGLIDLVGVTIVGGNNFVAYGANAALVMLEQIERTDIPVYMGCDEPINGVRDLTKQEETVGRIDHYGALYNYDSYISPKNYHNLGKMYERKWGYSSTEPQKLPAIEYLIEMVMKYPNEVTIISVGPSTNIATACLANSKFAENVAGIVYVGGIIDGSGSYTPSADFNCFYDPDAYDICFNSNFPQQMLIPRDAAYSAKLTLSFFEMLEGRNSSIISSLWLKEKASEYKRNPNKSSNCSDAIAAVCLLYPNVINACIYAKVQIETDLDSSKYGRISTEISDDGILIVQSVDTERYWDLRV